MNTTSISKRSLRLGLICLATLVVSVGNASDGQWNVEALMKSLSEVKHAKLDFVETKRSIFLVTDMVVEGNMEYRAPNYIERITVSPAVEKVVINGDEMVIEKTVDTGQADKVTQVRQYSVQSHPLLKATVESIRALLAGNFDMLTENYEMQLDGTREQWNLELLPRSDVILEYIEKIKLSGANTMVGEIVTIQADGDESIMNLSYQLLQ